MVSRRLLTLTEGEKRSQSSNSLNFYFRIEDYPNKQTSATKSTLAAHFACFVGYIVLIYFILYYYQITLILSLTFKLYTSIQTSCNSIVGRFMVCRFIVQKVYAKVLTK